MRLFRIGESNDSRLLVEADVAAGNKRGVIGFRYDSSGRLLPVTLLNANISDELMSEYRVIAIFVKRSSDSDYGLPLRLDERVEDWEEVREKLPDKQASLNFSYCGC